MSDRIAPYELDELIQKTNDSINAIEIVKIKASLVGLKSSLEDMKVATLELDYIEEQFRRGNIVTEVYFDKHKKLIRDYEESKDRAVDKELPSIAAQINSNNSKWSAKKLKQLLSDNKGFVLNIGMFLMDLSKLFGIH